MLPRSWHQIASMSLCATHVRHGVLASGEAGGGHCCKAWQNALAGPARVGDPAGHISHSQGIISGSPEGWDALLAHVGIHHGFVGRQVARLQLQHEQEQVVCINATHDLS